MRHTTDAHWVSCGHCPNFRAPYTGTPAGAVREVTMHAHIHHGARP